MQNFNTQEQMKSDKKYLTKNFKSLDWNLLCWYY